jgi:hypothetical protein
MKNIIKDVKLNCPECKDSPEKTVEFLYMKGDISYNSEHYREVWFFYLELVKTLKNKKSARETTLELFKLKIDKFKYIQRWAKRTSFISSL